MAPPLEKPITGSRIAANGSSRRVNTASLPEKLTEKIQRELGPKRDGLSRPAGGHAASAPSQDLATNSPHASDPHSLWGDGDEDGEERMPIPSTWRTPAAVAPAGWLARQVRAALLGLMLGLAAVVPTVLWLTGRLEGGIALEGIFAGEGESDRSSSSAMATAANPPILTSVPRPAERPDAEKDSAAATAEELLARARVFIAEGNMLRAREILGDRALADNPMAAFALAETFDPNILAATGALGARAEVERARMLYGKALAGGIAAAARRLDALR